jgi:hypothetical protein
MPTETEIKSALKGWLVDKGMDEKSAEYLADLYAKSEQAKRVAAPAPLAAGSCNIPGFFPG